MTQCLEAEGRNSTAYIGKNHRFKYIVYKDQRFLLIIDEVCVYLVL